MLVPLLRCPIAYMEAWSKENMVTSATLEFFLSGRTPHQANGVTHGVTGPGNSSQASNETEAPPQGSSEVASLVPLQKDVMA